MKKRIIKAKADYGRGPSLLSVGHGKCRHFTGALAADGQKEVCGRPSVVGSYCKEHGAIYYKDDVKPMILPKIITHARYRF